MYDSTFWILCLLLFQFQLGNASAQGWIRPPALKQGDTIAIVAPAGPIDIEPLHQFKRDFEKAGYQVQIPTRLEVGNPFSPDYLSGSDKERVDELNAAIRDPQVRAIFPARGGFGLTRILDKIDYQALQNDPKIIIGYSDITALHLAIARKIRMVTFHSPNAKELSRFDNSSNDFSKQSFLGMVLADQSLAKPVGNLIELPDGWQLESTKPGKVRGRLVGGNLSLICASIGTPYALDPQGSILILEDVGEAPYRVDRMLSQLKLAGVFEQVEGIVVGQFSVSDPAEAKQMERVILGHMQDLSFPVLLNFPVGHVPNNVTLPHGIMAELDGDLAQLKLLETPVAK